MSDEFGTVNMRASARSREIEIIRQHYRAHRDALGRLAAEAPTEHLAVEYTRLIADIDTSLRKLDELEGHGLPAAAPTAAAAPPRVASAASRPLVMTPGEPAPAIGRYDTAPERGTSSSSRIVLILVIGLAVLGALGWLIWRASSKRLPSTRPTVVEQPATTATTSAETGTVTPLAPSPASAASAIRITPAVQDYGIIRRGTRAVRQFELTNSGSIPLSIQVARSSCRCLYYEYNDKKKIAPNAHETITVTVDAARAKSPAIDEQLAVTAKEDPNASATIGVRATIK
jgi:hypothetical protein